MNERDRRRSALNRQKKLKQKKVFKNRIIFLTFTIIFTLTFVGVFRVVYIKASKGEEYEKNAIENQVNKVQDKIINPSRGSIL